MNGPERDLRYELEEWFRKSIVPKEKLDWDEALKRAFEPDEKKDKEPEKKRVENEWY